MPYKEKTMTIRVTWINVNKGSVTNKVYARTTPMTWPTDLPDKPIASLSNGETHVDLDLDPTVDWNFLIVSEVTLDDGSVKKVVSDQLNYKGVPQKAIDEKGLVVVDGGNLNVRYEYLVTDLSISQMRILSSGFGDVEETLAQEFNVQSMKVVSSGFSQTSEELTVSLTAKNLKLTTA